MLQQAFRTCLGGREGRDEIDDLRRGFARFGHRAGKLGDLRDKGPARSEIGVHLGTDLEGTYLAASPTPIDGLGLQIVCLRVSKIGLQVGVEGGLIAFDGQEGLGLQCMDEAQKLGVRVQGICGTHALLDG